MANNNYIHPAQRRQEEHEKRKEKKKKKRGLLWLLLILLLLAALLGGLGFGMGWFDGKGDGSSGNDGSTAAATQATQAETQKAPEDSKPAQKTTVSITVEGKEYVYNGKKFNLDDIKKELGTLDKAATVVEIVDSNAIEDDLKALKDALKELGIETAESQAPAVTTAAVAE